MVFLKKDSFNDIAKYVIKYFVTRLKLFGDLVTQRVLQLGCLKQLKTLFSSHSSFICNFPKQ